MTTFKSFVCGLCGGKVELKSGPGRTHFYRRGLALPVPESFEIPTCSACHEEYLSVERAEALNAALQPSFVELQKSHCREVVETIKAQHGATLRQIEIACGVTPTYLSHILAGRKEASDTLVYLLEAYSRHRSEFERRQAGGWWQQATAVQGAALQNVSGAESITNSVFSVGSGTSPVTLTNFVIAPIVYAKPEFETADGLVELDELVELGAAA